MYPDTPMENSGRLFSEEDRHWMERALTLAARGLGTTSPNPPVGAVIVQHGELVGEGYHEKAGEAHAERRALADARARGNGDKLKGATIYVTLEPCSSYGRTPPCTEAILEAGLGRVIYGAVDPDARHRGRADALLRAAGVDVAQGLCEAACLHLLRPWLFALRQGRPWVTAKIATTLDGRICRRRERWLSSAESLRYAHQMRLESDAILVGGGTVRADDPALTIRNPLTAVPRVKEQPWRVVLTEARSKLPAGCRLLTDEHAARTLVCERVADLRRDVLEPLYRERGVVRLMLECGGGLLRQFLEAGLVDEWVHILTPTLGGGEALAIPGGYLASEHHFVQESCQTSGPDVILRGILQE